MNHTGLKELHLAEFKYIHRERQQNAKGQKSRIVLLTFESLALPAFDQTANHHLN